MVIYVGDSKNVINRIRTNHCRGNVEGSKLREQVAMKMGFEIKKTKRCSGSQRKRIDIPIPKIGEESVSDYICSGEWRYVICKSYDEAHDFQWYVIERLKPCLNIESRSWKSENLQRYQALMDKLTKSPLLRYDQIFGIPISGPGVYILYHQQLPPCPFCF